MRTLNLYAYLFQINLNPLEINLNLSKTPVGPGDLRREMCINKRRVTRNFIAFMLLFTRSRVNQNSISVNHWHEYNGCHLEKPPLENHIYTTVLDGCKLSEGFRKYLIFRSQTLSNRRADPCCSIKPLSFGNRFCFWSNSRKVWVDALVAAV